MASVSIKSQTSTLIVLEVSLSDPFRPQYYFSAGITKNSFINGVASITGVLDSINPQLYAPSTINYQIYTNLLIDGNTYYVYAQDAQDLKYWNVGYFVYNEISDTYPPTPGSPYLIKRTQQNGNPPYPTLVFQFTTYSGAYYFDIEYKKTNEFWDDAKRYAVNEINDFLIDSGSYTCQFQLGEWYQDRLDFATTYNVRIRIWTRYSPPGNGYDHQESDYSIVATATTAPKGAEIEFMTPGDIGNLDDRFWFNIRPQAFNTLFTKYTISLKHENIIISTNDYYYTDGYNSSGYSYDNLNNGNYIWSVKVYYYVNGVYLSAVNNNGENWSLEYPFDVYKDITPTTFNWTVSELNAFINNGSTASLTYARWNAFIDKVHEWLVYKGKDNTQIGDGNEFGYPSNTTYSYVLNSAFANSSSSLLTALIFNSARYCIGSMNPTGITKKYQGDIVYGSYFITINNKLNDLGGN